ncbi:hypothetical protein CCYA_CCYA02G0738 [Cyanidiococcus yangmingshanensis]|nr:hypothetical protein CCYA_CCYA02G0738 [Cyanidiococcus yangmingshanensis]
MAEETLSSVLTDLAARFLLNLPASEFESFERLFFTIEEAHWFYLDFYRDHNTKLPALSLPDFASRLFEQVEFLRPYVQHLGKLFADFQAYKREVPTAGVAMLNENLDKVLLIRSWQRQQWSFPKGKIAKGETHLQCAIREATEETGFDVSNYIQADTYVDAQVHARPCRLFMAIGVPESASFQPLVRKEVSEIRWFSVLPLARHLRATSENDRQPDWPAPTKFQAVRPFLHWIRNVTKQLRQVRKQTGTSPGSIALRTVSDTDVPGTDETPRVDTRHQPTSPHWASQAAGQQMETASFESSQGNVVHRYANALYLDPLRHFSIDHQQLLAIFEEAFANHGHEAQRPAQPRKDAVANRSPQEGCHF